MRVTIEGRDGDYEGLARAARSKSLEQMLADEREPDLRRVVDEVVVLLAGAEAEKHAMGRYNHQGAKHDRQQAHRLAESVGSRPDLLVKWSTPKAQSLVKTWWPYIREMASRLEAKRTLNRSEIKEVMTLLPSQLGPTEQQMTPEN